MERKWKSSRRPELSSLRYPPWNLEDPRSSHQTVTSHLIISSVFVLWHPPQATLTWLRVLCWPLRRGPYFRRVPVQDLHWNCCVQKLLQWQDPRPQQFWDCLQLGRSGKEGRGELSSCRGYCAVLIWAPTRDGKCWTRKTMRRTVRRRRR